MNGKKRKVPSGIFDDITVSTSSKICNSNDKCNTCNQDHTLEVHDETATHHNSNDNPATTSAISARSPRTESRPSWKERLALAIEKRTQNEDKKKKYQRDIQMIKELMIDQHNRFRQRCVVSAAAAAAMEGPGSNSGSGLCGLSIQNGSLHRRKKNSVTGYDGGSRDYRLELIGIRYKSRPLDVTHGQSSNDFGLKLYMEVDILLNSIKKTQTEQQQQQTRKQHQRQLPNIDHPILFDLQLSCVSQKNIEGNDDSRIKIHTKSGIVPSLHIGQCVTILACVFVTDIHLIHGLSSMSSSSMSSSTTITTATKTPLSFVLNAFWNDNNKKYRCSSKTTKDIKCITLGLIQLSPDVLLINSSKTSSELQAYVSTTKQESSEQESSESSEFSSSSLSKRTRRTIYDYRQPTIIILDITNELITNPLSEWEYRITHSLDRYLGDGNKIDIQYNHNNEEETTQQHQLELRISIYAESIPHRSYLVELVKKHLPEGTIVAYSTNEVLTEESLMELLRKAIKDEIRIIAKHFKMDATSLTQLKDFRRDLISECKKKDMSLEEWEEFRCAQSRTDRLNDRLKNLRRDKVNFPK